MELEIKHLSVYLPYGLEVLYNHTKERGVIRNLYSIENYEDIKIGINFLDGEHIWMFKPILRPLSDLTKEINYGLSTYAFTDLFEIGDCDGCVFEFEHGNIKTIKALESISIYNSYNDINYLPSAVVNMMYEYHFDVFGLIDKGLAIDINTL